MSKAHVTLVSMRVGIAVKEWSNVHVRPVSIKVGIRITVKEKSNVHVELASILSVCKRLHVQK